MLGGEAELRWRFLTYQFGEDRALISCHVLKDRGPDQPDPHSHWELGKFTAAECNPALAATPRQFLCSAMATC